MKALNYIVAIFFLTSISLAYAETPDRSSSSGRVDTVEVEHTHGMEIEHPEELGEHPEIGEHPEELGEHPEMVEVEHDHDHGAESH